MSSLRAQVSLATVFVLALGYATSGGAGAAGSGSIKGVVSFSGKAPTASAIDRSSDAFCAKKKMDSEDVVVAKGKLKGVHVRIKNGTAGAHKPSSAPVVIEQSDCMYRPRVSGAMEGQPIVIRNADATMHNVHALIGTETWFNRSQPKGAPEIRETDTGKAGEVFELKCDVHKWMRAYVPITDHPFFDVTGDDGAFSIANVPAGTYTLEAWHPKLGLKTQKVTVGSGPARASFQF